MRGNPHTIKMCMILVYFTAIYLLSILILSIVVIFTKYIDMRILFLPIVNTLFVCYLLTVIVFLLADKFLVYFNEKFNIMLNILTIKIPKFINKLLYE